MKTIMLHHQLSWSMMVLSALCLASKVSTYSLRRDGLSSIDSAFRAEHDVRREELASDRQFWNEMTVGTEMELKRVVEAAGSSQKLGSKFASLQLADRLGSHRAVAPPSAPLELQPTVAMLDGLYEESKKRIVELNQHEVRSKQRYLEHQKEGQERMAEIEAEFKDGQEQHISAALRANHTALKNHLEDEDNFFLKYWGRVRERNRKQFHTCLKIQHGLMERLKSMREAYQQAAVQQPTAVQPEVAAAALIQHQSFVEEALGEIAALHTELAGWD